MAPKIASRMSLFLYANRMLQEHWFALSWHCGDGSGVAQASPVRELQWKIEAGRRALGLGFGSMLAVTLSWGVHHSILWMMLHSMLSWLYVIYYSIKR